MTDSLLVSMRIDSLPPVYTVDEARRLFDVFDVFLSVDWIERDRLRSDGYEYAGSRGGRRERVLRCMSTVKRCMEIDMSV